MPRWVLKGLELVFVSSLEEVFRRSLVREKDDGKQ